MIVYGNKSFSQCLDGSTPSGVGFDATVTTGSGNYESFFQGHPGPLTQQIIKNYGPYNLAANDGTAFSGPDFVTKGADTILNSVSIVNTITNAAGISNFYGLDSLAYRYAMKVNAVRVGVTGDYLFSAFTTGFVNFKLEYCYCPPFILPVGLKDYLITKTDANTARLNWQAAKDTLNYFYEIQTSRDEGNFTTSDIVQKQSEVSNASYYFQFTMPGNEYGLYYFKVKRRYTNGFVKFSAIKSVEFQNTVLSKIFLCPNPSSGIVGIKFVNIPIGNLCVSISNVQGQTVVRKESEVSGSDYKQIAVLQRGMYWMRFTDVSSKLSFVNQLLIK
ncbi:MAG: T9SS type A sorting domain-containing protein [Bacteroidota bacterium]|nr:T9SS type A sorting domain-containing protein [Bacteroidota bacterium]